MSDINASVEHRIIIWAATGLQDFIELRLVEIPYKAGRTWRILEGFHTRDALGVPMWKTIDIDQAVLKAIPRRVN